MRKIAVNYEDLKSYMDEYHNPNPTGHCKADGHKWPCQVYLSLRQAVDKPEENWYSRPTNEERTSSMQAERID